MSRSLQQTIFALRLLIDGDYDEFRMLHPLLSECLEHLEAAQKASEFVGGE